MKIDENKNKSSSSKKEEKKWLRLLTRACKENTNLKFRYTEICQTTII